MSEDNDIINISDNTEDNQEKSAPAAELSPTEKKTVLSGMFRDWYLEYASYVILERAVPSIEDGLKPVQRRILHSMQTIDDGRFNKAANIVGNTMQYHPHGDASIGDALVQLGQKKLLIDTQGNWGNILTGDDAAAPRYIEARLSEFAIETAFSPKITDWGVSYDGRKKEPVTLPMKFPLLLMQGVEGIAVGLSSKILPHNFNEILDAAIDYLHDRPFKLLPDFQTGGLLDVTKYNDGGRGGSVKVRAKIEKIDNKTLAITELPYGKTTATLIPSILSAVEKGKIKIKSVDDNTAATAEILIHLAPGTSSDKAIDALYAFTDCEVSISPNCCVIRDRKPAFLTVSELLRHSVDSTKDMLRRELEIKLGETREQQLFASIEKIFIEQRMYKDAGIENAPDMETAIRRLDELFEPFKADFFRPLTDEEIIRLHGMVMRNRSTPIAIRKSMAQHLVAMASADVRGYLDTPEPVPSAGSKATKATRTPIKRIDTCELVEQAIDHGTTVSFDISSVTTRGETEAARMTLRPFAIRQRDGISYLLGTVYDARGADDTLRTVEIGRMRNVTTRLLDGKKLFAALDEDDASSAA